MLAFRKELVASRMNGLDEILLKVVPYELVDNDVVTRQHILKQDKPSRPLNSEFLYPSIFY